MNFKLIFKALLIVAVLALLVILGLYNTQTVTLTIPKSWGVVQPMPAALMYYIFFGVGFLVGAIMMAGGGKKGSGAAKSNKAQT
jgi:uncharacterized integral membrane protein